jgi:hypothetical protein
MTFSFRPFYGDSSQTWVNALLHADLPKRMNEQQSQEIFNAKTGVSKIEIMPSQHQMDRLIPSL